MDKGLEKIRDLTWEEVFYIWRKNEAGNPKWQEHWENRGFKSWEEWRMQYAGPWRCAERSWALYAIIDPEKTIPKFQGGPFKTWIERHYGGKPKPTMVELAAREDMQTNQDNLNLLNNFPKETTLTGLIQDGEVVIIEGMHRCVAVALAAQQGRDLSTHITIALADASGENLPTVGGFPEKK